MKDQRMNWVSKRSDIISFAKLLVDYFNFVNDADAGGDFEKATY